MNEQELEKEINEKNLNAPRISPKAIDSKIRQIDYYQFPNNKDTVCLITLVNGFTVLGRSACVSPENFDKEIGQEIAFENAREQIWQLEGYLLQQQLFENK